MKRSNWIIMAALLAASLFFLWLWLYLGFDKVHSLDLFVVIAWWVLIAVLCVAFVLLDRIRRAKIRSTYIGDTYMFNNGAGVMAINEGERKTSALIRILSGLSYDDHIEGFPQGDGKDRLHFDFVVYSKKFKDYGNIWEGEVVDLSAGDRSVSFANRQELVDIIEK